jgi:hypothetical protein
VHPIVHVFFSLNIIAQKITNKTRELLIGFGDSIIGTQSIQELL